MRTKYSMLNMCVSVFGQILNMILAMVGRAYLVRCLSVEYFGLTGVLSNIFGLLSLAELGIGTAMLYSFYRPAAAENELEIVRLMNFFRQLYRCVAVFIFCCGMVLLPFVKIYVVKDSDINGFYQVYFLYMINTLSTYLYSYKHYVIDAHQKNYINSVYFQFSLLLKTVIQIVLFMVSRNFVLYLFPECLVAILYNVLLAMRAERMYPYIKNRAAGLPERETQKKIFRDIMALGAKRIGTVLVTSTDSLIISASLGLVEGGVYSIYQYIITSVKSILTRITSAFNASIGNLIVLESKEKVYEIYNTLCFAAFFVTGYICMMIFTLSNPFVRLFFGEEFLYPIWTVFLLCLSLYLLGMRQIPLNFKEASGLFWKDRYSSLAEAFVNLVVSLGLVGKYGINGVVAGTIVSSLATNFWFEPYVFLRQGIKDCWKKRLAIYYVKYFRNTLSLVLACFLSWKACALIEGNTFVALVLKACLSSIVYLLTMAVLYGRISETRYLYAHIAGLLKGQREKKMSDNKSFKEKGKK